ncbi:MAG: hypothetical protein HY894_07075 [Deltaproteobacteria bacterium]|nr:hypothetical protein [Deltaproteobacteria bacterium]
MVKAGDDIFFTKSMAEILEKQGHYEDALTIYKILLDSAPGGADESLAEKVRTLKNLAERGRRKDRA